MGLKMTNHNHLQPHLDDERCRHLAQAYRIILEAARRDKVVANNKPS